MPKINIWLNLKPSSETVLRDFCNHLEMTDIFSYQFLYSSAKGIKIAQLCSRGNMETSLELFNMF